MTNQNLARLSEAGVAVWLDDLSRDRISSGGLMQLVDEYAVVGVTTNPTIFQGAISKSSAYDEQVGVLAKQDMDAGQVVRELTTDDVRNAADLLRGVSERTSGIDGRVSIEVDPRAAHDEEETISQARDLWAKVDRPNIFIKIPATLAGLPAITTAISEGISVNVTLIFGIERYQAVLDAYATGLEQRVEQGKSLAGITSVASFFVSRVDSEVDKRLDVIASSSAGSEEATALKGKAAVANARLAYGAFLQFSQSQRWQKLAAVGANPQRPLWASTGVKNPDYRDTMYVDDLVAAGIVNTMPEATLKAVADHSSLDGDTITGNIQDAQHVMAQLQQVGIDIADVTKVLEDEGVEKFEVSWNDLLKTVEASIEENR